MKKLIFDSKTSAQLEKMRHQDKHQYKDTRDRWQYAYNKVTASPTSKK